VSLIWSRTPHVTLGPRVRAGAELAVVAVDSLGDLDRLSTHRKAIAEDGHLGGLVLFR
jgi:hypothetical protein